MKSFYSVMNHLVTEKRVNWIIMTINSGQHLSATHGNTGLLFRPVHISPTRNRTSDHRMQSRNSTSEPTVNIAYVTPNQLVMVIVRPINVSCKLHLYSLQRTPPGPGLPKRIGNTYPRNYHNLKGKDIDVHYFK